jgi:AcrR family transcriptional regulator
VRAAAARNRRGIVAAAAELVGERGIDAVSMDDVARAAQVGTGTLYRRFGDRAGLAFALLDEHARAFQDALLSGPAPLGPGAPPFERLCAFGDGYVDLLERHAELILAAGPTGRDGSGPHQLYATHVAVLLREAECDVEAHFAAEALLASLAPGHYVHLRRNLGWDVGRIREGWRSMVAALTLR